MARERYLVNAGEDTIHANEIKPETPKQKRQNWWFYHKVPLIVTILLAGVAFSIVYSIVSQVEPDYTVALLTSYTMPESGTKELERCISAYADDRNGDGQVVVEVANYVFSSSVPSTLNEGEQLQAEMVKLTADCTSNDSMIFLHDEAAFEMMENNFGGLFQYNDGTTMPTTALDYENAMRPWSDFQAFSQFEPVGEEGDSFTGEVLSQLYGKLRVSIRAAEGSSIEKKEKDLRYYQASLELYRRLETGEAPESGEGR